MTLTLKLLGEFALRDASGAELSLPTRKTRALLGYLAVNADRPQPRERLMALLWSDRGERQARQSLNQALLSIRKLGDGAALIDSDGERVTLRSEAMNCDVGRLRSAAKNNPAKAANLYEGPFLDGLSVPEPAFEEWLLATRSELHALACDALEAATKDDDIAVAIDCAKRLVALDPLREDAHRRLMELLHKSGDRTGALRQYQACAEILQRELQVEPDATTKALFEAIRQDGGSAEPPNLAPVTETVIPCAPKKPPEPATAAVPKEPQRTKRWFYTEVAVALIFLIGAGLVAWLKPWADRTAPGHRDPVALTLPDKPSIAILPFLNMSNDPDQEYFVDGITEDLITDLSKISGLFVISRNSAFAYKGKAVKVEQAAGELGVRYVLEGSVCRAGRQVRINTQLVDAITGGQMWAERYDGTLNDVFALQDEITRKITRALTLELTPSELRSVADRGTKVIAAHDAFLKGWNRYLQATPEDLAAAAARFKEAITLDPNYGRAHAALALTYWLASERFWEIHLGVNWMRARILMTRHLETALKTPSVTSHRLASLVYLTQRRHEESIEAARHAIGLSPNSPDAYRVLTYALIMNGQTAEARQMVEKAWRLDPRAAGQHFFLLGLIAFADGKMDQSIDLIERARAHTKHAQSFLPPLIAAYTHSGRAEEGRKLSEIYYNEYSTSMHTTELRDIMFLWPFRNTTVASRLANGLLLAGIPGKRGGFYSLSDEHRLTGTEIANLFEQFGPKWKIRDIREFGDYPMNLSDSYRKDGTVVRAFEDYWNYGPIKYTWTGRHWIDGDSLCVKFQQIVMAGGVGCHSVFKFAATAPNRAKAYVMVGILGFYEIRAIN